MSTADLQSNHFSTEPADGFGEPASLHEDIIIIISPHQFFYMQPAEGKAVSGLIFWILILQPYEFHHLTSVLCEFQGGSLEML